MSLQQCFESFLRSKQTRCRPQTVRFYLWLQGVVSQMAASTGHWATPVNAINRAVLEQWVINMYDRAAAGEIRDTTIKKVVKFLKQFFAYLADEGFIENDPAVKLKCRTAHAVETRPFTGAELSLLFSVEPRTPAQFRDWALWLLLCDTGARCQESVSLQMNDWQDTVIRIRNGKGGRYREIGMGTRTTQALRDYVERYRPQPVGEDRLFLTGEGRPLDTLRVNARLHSWAKKVGVQKAAPHRFRATFATRFVRNGGERDLIRLQALLGHSTIDMSRRYVKLAEAEEAVLTSSAASIVDELMMAAPTIAEGDVKQNTLHLPVEVAVAMQTLLKFIEADPNGHQMLGQLIQANRPHPNIVNIADSLGVISSGSSRSSRLHPQGAGLQGRAEQVPPEPRSGKSQTHPTRKEVTRIGNP